VKVANDRLWKKGHRGSDPSNPDKLSTPVAETRLVSSLLGMTIWVRVLGHPRVSDLMGAGVGPILHPRVAPTPDPHRDEFGHEFSFAPVGDPTGASKRPNNIFHSSPQRLSPARSPS
jgi:hypothetical protein